MAKTNRLAKAQQAIFNDRQRRASMGFDLFQKLMVAILLAISVGATTFVDSRHFDRIFMVIVVIIVFATYFGLRSLKDQKRLDINKP